MKKTIKCLLCVLLIVSSALLVFTMVFLDNIADGHFNETFEKILAFNMYFSPVLALVTSTYTLGIGDDK